MNSQTKTIAPSMQPPNKTGSGIPDTEVVIIGAGPYGLSAGAHLLAAGIDVRIFGKPMEFWDQKMPAGMLLRSPRIASNLSAPASAHMLDDYEVAAGLAPKTPVPLATFVQYGQWFQQQAVPNLDFREVQNVTHSEEGFRIILEDGVSFSAKRVVVAAGIGPFKKIPEVFQSLPSSQMTHCYSGFEVHSFRGKRVAVIGAGQSSLESAALLHEAGAQVEIIARIPALRWIGQHPWLHHLGPVSSMLYSKHDIGPAGISRLVAGPNLLRRIPLQWRDKIRTRAVRSAGSNWLPARLKNVSTKTSRFVVEARSAGSMVNLKLNDGTSSSFDHVLLGTGYSVDISKYEFLSSPLLQGVQLFEGYPVLKPGFESSLPGLHFIGASAARVFGPLLYFVTGTEFASEALTSKIVRNARVRR